MIAQHACFGTRVVVLIGAGALLAMVACHDGQSTIDELRAAAEQGDGEAQFVLGVWYADGRGVPQDDGEAALWYRLAADQDHARAQVHLGVMYEIGRGVPQDAAEAVRWHRRAADQGYDLAQASLGLMYANGRGVAQDDVEAHVWLNLAAMQGFTALPGVLIDGAAGSGVTALEAIVQRMTADQLAEAHQRAREELSFDELLRLAEQSDAVAQFVLGVRYVDGRGVSRDNREAAKWFHLAAAQGHAHAQLNIGVMFANGRGVPQDDVEAHTWLSLAATQGPRPLRRRAHRGRLRQ